MTGELDDDEVYCRDCGEVIDERAEICPNCGIRQKEPELSNSQEKNPGLAAVASFLIPGLGQVYNGQIAKGIVLGAITVISAVTVIGLLLAIPLWIWLVYDAYKVAERGGASADSTGGGAAPRTWTRHALTWYEETADDPQKAKEMRNQIMSTKLGNLHEDNKEFIIEVVAEYDEEHGTERLPAVRDAVGK